MAEQALGGHITFSANLDAVFQAAEVTWTLSVFGVH